MSKGLKKFLQERPTSEEVARMFAEIASDGPRGATMVATAIIDDVLVGAIRYRMVKLTKEEDEGLFGPDRPLGSFSARIRVAYGFGIVGRKTHHDLEILRKIRNAFAHGRRAMSFDTPEIATLCKAFHCIKDIVAYKTLTPRQLFTGAVELLMFYIVSKIGPFPPGIEGVKIEGITELD